MKLNIHEIKDQFSKYIDMVESGQTIVVCKRNIPVAEIRPIEKKSSESRFSARPRVPGRFSRLFISPCRKQRLDCGKRVMTKTHCEDTRWKTENAGNEVVTR